MSEPRMRFRTATRAEVHVEGALEGGGRQTLVGTTTNVSVKGLYFRPDRWLPLGVDCQVTISSPGLEPGAVIRARGRVARSDSKGLGIEFVEMDAESFTNLRNLIRYNAADTAQVERELERHAGAQPRSSGE